MNHQVSDSFDLFMGVSELPILLAIRRGLIQVLPLIIVGAAALLMLHLPIPLIRSLIDTALDGGLRNLLQIIQNGSFGIASLAALFCISQELARSHQGPDLRDQINPNLASAVCLAAYFVLIAPLNQGIDPRIFSFGGGFPLALCTALTATHMFIFLARRSRFNKYLRTAGIDHGVREAMGAIPAGVITISLFGLARMLLEQLGWADLNMQTQALFMAPFAGAQSNLGTGVGYVALSQGLWFFGVHGPNLLFGVEENILAQAARGQPGSRGQWTAPRLYPYQTLFGRVCAHRRFGQHPFPDPGPLIAKQGKKHKAAGLDRPPPIALFNVNEVLLFGLPLVLNPVYLLPFLAAPVLQTLLAYAVTTLGLVPVATGSMHWTSPILLGGFTATGSIAGAILQVACLAAGCLVYLPFVKLANSLQQRRFQKAMQALGQAAEGTQSSPGGKKCIELPGQTGQVARALAADLDLAMQANDQLFLVYQPQVDVELRQTVGLEALLRWRHPVYGLIPPHVTVALAEDCDLISGLGMWILHTACSDSLMLKEQGISQPVLSVNMSPLQFNDAFLVEKVKEVLAQTGLEPKRLKIEVTESVALRPDSNRVSMLRKLRKLGVRVAIDDFGMGHTSLRYLRELPVDTVKIDRSLTQESADGVNDHIVTSIVSLCKALGIQIIIEGVETPEQLERFMAHGCVLYQGYLFSKPLGLQDFVEFYFEEVNLESLTKAGSLGEQG